MVHKGRRQPGEDLVDFTPGDATLRYWAKFDPETGKKLETSREDACEEVAVAILNMLIGRCWGPAQGG